VSGFSRTDADISGLSRTAGILGGEWRRREGSSCFVVERRYAPDAVYGRDQIATIAARLNRSAAEAQLVMAGAPAPTPFFFFDLETTGLSGGAGTYAFLVGCGAFADDGAFVTRQFLLLRPTDERPLLRMVGAELADAGVLVTFNGKSFDAPLIETRYLFHRLKWTGGALPHLDLLHPARRFWGDRGGAGSPCSLQMLEQLILAVRRTGDAPGFEIPARYFQFVRTGDSAPLAAVLEHNRRDLLSLAALTARLLDLVKSGSDAVDHPGEALALGHVYAHGGLDGRARDAFERACAMASTASIKLSATRRLALLSRRARRFDEAAMYWRALLEIPACPHELACEASQALAVHHEHRARDLPVARAFALRSLDARKPAWNQAVQHRLARIERKLSGGAVRPRATEPPRLFPS
jgi:uncharacterized protein YprB with RNaseH-like and TPR domain